MYRSAVERKWHVVDDGVLPYALTLMRAAWLTPLLHFVWRGLFLYPPMPGALADPFPWFVLCGLLALSMVVTQVAAHRIRSDRGAAVLTAVTGLLVVMLALYVVLASGWSFVDLAWLAHVADYPFHTALVLLVTVGLWWWGMVTGRETLFYESYAANFGLGVGGLALAAVCSRLADIITLDDLLGPALGFFAISLTTLAVASLRNTRRLERERQDPSFSVSRDWLVTVAIVIVAVLVLGLILAQLFSPQVIRRLQEVAELVLAVFARLIFYLAVAIAWVFFKFVDVTGINLQPNSKDDAEPRFQLRLPEPDDQLRDTGVPPPGLSPEWYLILRILGGLVIVAVVVVIFVLAFRRFRAFFEEDVEEIRESVLSLDLLKEQLADLWSRRRPSPPAPPPFILVEGEDPVAAIRRAYQTLLAWAASQGHPRGPGVTPSAYADLLGLRFPAQAAAITELTGLYLEARYSASTLTSAHAQQAAAAVGHISG